MAKTRISIFFSVIFVLFIVAPTVISVIEDSYDVSIFYNVSEEESQSQNEISKQSEVKFINTFAFASWFWQEKEQSLINCYIKNYTPLTPECASPPPEQYIL